MSVKHFMLGLQRTFSLFNSFKRKPNFKDGVYGSQLFRYFLSKITDYK